VTAGTDQNPEESSAPAALPAVNHASWKSRVSIKWLVPIMIVLPVVIISAVVIPMDYHTSRHAINELADENTLQIHQSIQEHLARLMEMPPRINALDKRMLQMGTLSLTDMDSNREPVFQTLRIFPAVSSIVIGNAKGPTMWVIRYPGATTYEYAIKKSFDAPMEEYTLGDDGNTDSPRLASYDYQPTRRPWYKAAINAGAPTWGDVYIWVRHGKGETLGVPYVEPIRDSEGKIIGVINAELTLADISEFLAKQRVGKTGKTFIEDQQGKLIATSVGLDCMTDDLKRIDVASASDPWIAAVAREITKYPSPYTGVNDVVRADVTVDDQPMRLVASPYSNRRNLNWLIVTIVPDSDFLGDVNSSRNRAIAVSLGIVGLMLLASAAAVFALLRPILKLVSHVRQVGEGKLDGKLVLDDSREMAQLSHAINEMVDGLSDRMKLRHALSVAMDVQQSLLPASTPAIRGVEVAAFSKYCDQTGGDYYDYLDVAGLSENSLVIALGDVMGHGVAAAMLMATARGMLRSRGRVTGSLADLLTHVNELLAIDTGGSRFMTMLVGIIDSDTRQMRWASAGHDAPFVYDPIGDSFSDLDTPNGLPLGVNPDEKYEESAAFSFRPGQIMILGTDGLWEARDHQDVEFGRERLKQAMRELAGKSAREIQIGLYDKLRAYCGTKEIEDDVTYVVVKFTDVPAPRKNPSESPTDEALTNTSSKGV
jgi:sigma-B regulation protein RsbU (phosphoserine phosphatase)